jgi:hypothetical protein
VSQPREYGFYAIVNPQVDHPRRSASERRISSKDLCRRQETPMFNGYADQVASLYQGMIAALLQSQWHERNRPALGSSAAAVRRLPGTIRLALGGVGRQAAAVVVAADLAPTWCAVLGMPARHVEPVKITPAVTPLRQLTGNANLPRLRRMLGVFAFFTRARTSWCTGAFQASTGTTSS